MKVSTGTIARTVVLVIALVNQVITALGYNPLPWSDEGIYEAATAVLTVGAALVAWWRNNSFTQEAIEADEYMNDLKANKE
jgi:SPP1 family holin